MTISLALFAALVAAGLSTSLAQTPGTVSTAPKPVPAPTASASAAGAGAGAGCAKLPKPGGAVSLATFPLQPGPQSRAAFVSKFNTWTKAHPQGRTAFCWAKAVGAANVTCLSIWPGAAAPAQEPLAAALGPALASPGAVAHDATGNEHVLMFTAGGAKADADCKTFLDGIPPQGSAVTVFANPIKPDKWAAGRDYFFKTFLPAAYNGEPRRAMVYWVDKDKHIIRGISIWQDPAAAKAWTTSPVRKRIMDDIAQFTAPEGITHEYAVLLAHSLLAG